MLYKEIEERPDIYSIEDPIKFKTFAKAIMDFTKWEYLYYMVDDIGVKYDVFPKRIQYVKKQVEVKVDSIVNYLAYKFAMVLKGWIVYHDYENIDVMVSFTHDFSKDEVISKSRYYMDKKSSMSDSGLTDFIEYYLQETFEWYATWLDPIKMQKELIANDYMFGKYMFNIRPNKTPEEIKYYLTNMTNFDFAKAIIKNLTMMDKGGTHRANFLWDSISNVFIPAYVKVWKKHGNYVEVLQQAKMAYNELLIIKEKPINEKFITITMALNTVHNNGKLIFDYISKQFPDIIQEPKTFRTDILNFMQSMSNISNETIQRWYEELKNVIV